MTDDGQPAPDLSPATPADATSAPAVVTSMSQMAVGQVVGQVAWFGSLIWLSALLDPIAFGTVTAGLVLVNAVLPLLGAATGGTLVVTRRLAPGEIWSSIRTNLAIAVALVTIIMVFARPIIGLITDDGNADVLRWLSLAIFFNAVTIAPLALLKRTMRFGRHSLADVGAYVGAGVVAVTTALSGGGVWSLVTRLVLYQALLAALALFFARHLLFGSGAGDVEDEGGDVRRGGSWFLLLAVTQFVAANADYVVVGRLAGTEQLGLYGLGFTLAFAPLRQFSWQIGRVLFSASAATEDADQLRRRVTTSLRLGAAVLLPVIVPAVLAARSLLPLVLGEKWEPMVPVFQILIVAGIVHAVSNLVGEFLSGSGHIDLRAGLSSAWAVGVIVAVIILVPRWGIEGAAIAHVLTAIPLAVALLVLGADRLSLPRAAFLRALTPSALAVVAQVAVGAVAVVGGAAIGLPAAASYTVAAALTVAAAALALSRGSEPPLADLWAMVGGALRRSRAGAAR